jgi:hypothetical protein
VLFGESPITTMYIEWIETLFFEGMNEWCRLAANNQNNQIVNVDKQANNEIESKKNV